MEGKGSTQGRTHKVQYRMSTEYKESEVRKNRDVDARYFLATLTKLPA